jgi:hypothetical protein
MPPQPSPEQLRFDADFECGNLERVQQVSPYEYAVYLRADTLSPR